MKENKITIEKEYIDSILGKLNAIKLSTYDVSVKKDISELIDYINSNIIPLDISLIDLIVDKMKETKYTNEDLHFKLYMLERKLSDGKISESEAYNLYKLYVG